MSLYNKFFYNETIRKYVIVFGNMFSDIQVIRKNSNGEEIRRESVPLTYAPKEKFVARLEQDYDEGRKVAIKLPRMAFEITGYNYAPERKLSSFRKMTDNNLLSDTRTFSYNPVPYDIDFELSVFTKSQEEGLQIIEQIIPFFTPHYTVTAKLLKDLPDCKFDIPVSLVGVTSQDTYEGNFEERRSIEWTLSFKMSAWLFGPSRKQGVVLTSVTNTIAVNEVPDLDKSFADKVIAGIVESNVGEQNSLESTLELYEPEGENFHIITKGLDSAISLEVNDETTGEPIDLESGTIRARYRKDFSDVEPIDLNTTVSEDGLVIIEIPGQVTEIKEDGLYIFEVFLDEGEDTTKLVQGSILLK